MVTGTVLLGGVTVAATAWPYVLPIIQNRSIWAAISLIAILLFTSGHMFNHIRKVPYVAGDGKGGVSYFAGSFQSQYGMETQVVATICKLDLVPPNVSLIVPCLPSCQTVFSPFAPSRWLCECRASQMFDPSRSLYSSGAE